MFFEVKFFNHFFYQDSQFVDKKWEICRALSETFAASAREIIEASAREIFEASAREFRFQTEKLKATLRNLNI